MTADFDVSGRLFVITGASQGIGRGLVDYFLARGVRIAAVTSNSTTAQALLADLGGADGIQVYGCDLREPAGIPALFAAIEDAQGTPDVLLNVAGMGQPIPALEVTPQDWDSMMDLNLRAQFFCAQAAARLMLAQPKPKGRIIMMSSQLGRVANVDEAVYCASKGGLEQLTRVLALEWGHLGIAVTGVAPTFTYTPGTAERLDDPAFAEGVLARIPLGRFGTLDEVGAAVHYLASDAGEMANGTTLVIDGGWTAV